MYLSYFSIISPAYNSKQSEYCLFWNLISFCNFSYKSLMRMSPLKFKDKI